MLANLRQRLNSWRVLAASGALFTVSQATLVVLVLPLGADVETRDLANALIVLGIRLA